MKRLSLVGSAVLLCASLMPSPAIAAQPAGPSAHTLKPGSGFARLAERANADGTVTTTYGRGAARVVVSGFPGLTVTITPNGVATAAAPIDKLSPSAALDAISRYAAAGRSVERDAIAVGVPADKARKYHSSASSQRIYAMSPLAPQLGVSDVPLAYTSGQTIQSWCSQVSSSSGKTTTTGCYEEVMDQDNGNGDWYVIDKVTESGHSTDTNFWFPERLSGIYEKVYFGANNSLVTWNPTTTTPTNPCMTLTFGVTGQSGFSASVSQQVCPNSQGPWVVQGSPAAFGTQWSGHENGNDWEGNLGIDKVHSPPSALNDPTLYVTQTL